MIALKLHLLSYNLRKWPVVSDLISIVLRVIFSAQLPKDLYLPATTKLGYQGLGIVIHPRAIIGSNCLISQNVTIGGTSKKHGVPRIGNDVYIGAGAVVLGDITLGDNVVVGANSVVTKSFGSGVVIAGVPARIIQTGILKSDFV